MEDFDVLVIGAGLSGVGVAWHLATQCPEKTFAVLERRESFGGTWDLFRYPGVRSDTDMFTYGYHFKPWGSARTIATGGEILEYLREVLTEFDLEKYIRYSCHIVAADWSTPEARWLLRTADGRELRCRFLVGCAGVYNYDQPHEPQIPGQDAFRGRIVHPQRWLPDINFEDKRVAVIGSGATAITLVPAVAAKAEHVTMVQRSPSYIAVKPMIDPLVERLQRVLPATTVHYIIRAKYIILSVVTFALIRRYPEFAKKNFVEFVEKQLKGHMDCDEVRKHFQPRYNPWDQRICVSPDGDFFSSMRQGKVSVVTGNIECFTESGLLMEDGTKVEADLVVTATGWELSDAIPMSTMRVSVDGRPYDAASSVLYKGLMLSGVPNFAFLFGYINASWTLKVNLSCAWLVRLLKHMDHNRHTAVTPKAAADVATDATGLWPMTSNFVKRAAAEGRLPKAGDQAPWTVYHNYFQDVWGYRAGVGDPSLVFDGGRRASRL